MHMAVIVHITMAEMFYDIFMQTGDVHSNAASTYEYGKQYEMMCTIPQLKWNIYNTSKSKMTWSSKFSLLLIKVGIKVRYSSPLTQ